MILFFYLKEHKWQIYRLSFTCSWTTSAYPELWEQYLTSSISHVTSLARLNLLPSFNLAKASRGETPASDQSGEACKQAWQVICCRVTLWLPMQIQTTNWTVRRYHQKTKQTRWINNLSGTSCGCLIINIFQSDSFTKCTESLSLSDHMRQVENWTLEFPIR